MEHIIETTVNKIAVSALPRRVLIRLFLCVSFYVELTLMVVGCHPRQSFVESIVYLPCGISLFLFALIACIIEIKDVNLHN